MHFQNTQGASANDYSITNYPWPIFRLAQLYLLYAEALNEKSGPDAEVYRYINLVRERAGLQTVQVAWSTYSNNKGKYLTQPGLRAIIHRETLIELAFEGARFCDLRRWNLNGDPRYLEKTAIDFSRGANGKPVNLVERVVVRRAVEKKHNWLPIQVSFTRMYKDFPQNPGW